MHDDLLETLRDAQRFGFFGRRPIEEAAAHSSAFADAIGPLAAGSRLVDLGSGGGLPGLVLADRYPQATIVLIDRREKRTDFLRRAALRLGFDHVEVIAGDVEQLVRGVRADTVPPFDVATARGFGPPENTLRFAAGLIGPRGSVVISEPPAGDRWDPWLLDELQLDRVPAGAVSIFHRR